MRKKNKRNRGWKWAFFILILAACIVAGFELYNWWQERAAHFVRYTAFGIDIPMKYSIHGIDVSKYKNIIDWESVKEMNVDHVHIDFAFIKATEGLGNEDAVFARNW